MGCSYRFATQCCRESLHGELVSRQISRTCSFLRNSKCHVVSRVKRSRAKGKIKMLVWNQRCYKSPARSGIQYKRFRRDLQNQNDGIAVSEDVSHIILVSLWATQCYPRHANKTSVFGIIGNNSATASPCRQVRRKGFTCNHTCEDRDMKIKPRISSDSYWH